MARDLFIDTTNRRLAVSTTNLAPATIQKFVRGDTGVINLYFLEATGIINNPFRIVDNSDSTVKFAIGSRTGTPTDGTYTLSFSAQTTGAINYSATAGTLQSALSGLSTISAAGGIEVTGSPETTFVFRFKNNGDQAAITANTSQLIPSTTASINTRLAGTPTSREIQDMHLRLNPAVLQTSWSSIGTTITATVETIVTGSEFVSELQQLSFSRNPSSGSFRLTMPSQQVAVTGTIVDGLFNTIENHGLLEGQVVTITGNWTNLNGADLNVPYQISRTSNPKSFYLFDPNMDMIMDWITGSAISGQSFMQTQEHTTTLLDHNASESEIQNALKNLPSIGTGNVIVNGAEGSYFYINFINVKGFTNLPQLVVTNFLIGAAAKTASVDFTSASLRDLLENNLQATLDLEIELTDANGISTMILTPCIVQEQLIY
jgi:hypothetical protein